MTGVTKDTAKDCSQQSPPQVNSMLEPTMMTKITPNMPANYLEPVDDIDYDSDAEDDHLFDCCYDIPPHILENRDELRKFLLDESNKPVPRQLRQYV